MLSEPDLSAVVDTITPVSLTGTFARRVPLAALLGMNAPVVPGVALQIVSPRFLLTPTSAYRYNSPGVAALYLGEGENVAAAEVKQHPGLAGFARKPSPPDTLFHVEVTLAAVLDLTDLGVQSVLSTTVAELTAPWRLRSPNAPTQLLGAAVVAGARFEAIRYPCAPLQHAGECGVSLVVFRKSFWPGSTVKVHDPGGTWHESWP
jgi:RES domain-containing protein